MEKRTLEHSKEYIESLIEERASSYDWKLPSYNDKVTTVNVKRANKYLHHMQKRVNYLREQGEYKKIWNYYDILFRRSDAFNIYLYTLSNRS